MYEEFRGSEYNDQHPLNKSESCGDLAQPTQTNLETELKEEFAKVKMGRQQRAKEESRIEKQLHAKHAR